MRNLHPKAVWLFFWPYFFVGVIIFLFPVFLGLGMVVPALLAGDIVLTSIIFLAILIIFFALPAIFAYLLATLTYKNYRFEIRDDALRIERGVIWKKYISIPYERIQNVDIYRGILSRLLNLSDLQVQTAGYSGYRGYGFSTEGKLPGLGIKEAEELRDELVRRTKGKKQGL